MFPDWEPSLCPGNVFFSSQKGPSALLGASSCSGLCTHAPWWTASACSSLSAATLHMILPSSLPCDNSWILENSVPISEIFFQGFFFLNLSTFPHLQKHLVLWKPFPSPHSDLFPLNAVCPHPDLALTILPHFLVFLSVLLDDKAFKMGKNPSAFVFTFM